MSKTYEEVQRALRANAEDEFGQDAFKDLPPDLGVFLDPPQPGAFRMKLPEDLRSLWDVLEVVKYGEDGQPVLHGPTLATGLPNPEAGKPVLLQRVQVIFTKDHPLTIVQSKNGKYDGDPFLSRLSNVERWRSMQGSKQRIKVNDLIYFLRVFDPSASPKNNADFIAQLNAFGGREFGVDLEWTGYCNDEKDAYFFCPVEGKPGEYTYELNTHWQPAEPTRKGCGGRVYGNKWPRGADGLAQERAACPGKNGQPCGAALRPFAQLRGFRS